MAVLPGSAAASGSLLLGVAALACVAPPASVPSEWPPDDFYLEVRQKNLEKESRRLRVWADGFAVYREANAWLRGPDSEDWLPVFTTVSAYEMRPESVRSLSRLLERAGLRRIDSDASSGVDVAEEVVSVRWRAFAREGQILAGDRAQGGVARVLHVINAFTPERRKFVPGSMLGEPEPRHLVEVPEPLDSLESSLAFHVDDLLARFPDDFDLRVDVLALALEAGRRDLAQEQLDQLERLVPGPEQPLGVFPEDRRSLLSELRALVQRRGGSGESPQR